MSRNFTFHSGGIPRPVVPDLDANGCCSLCIDLSINTNNNIDDYSLVNTPTTRSGCLKLKQDFDAALKIETINGRKVITNKTIDLDVIENYINNDDWFTFSPNRYFRFLENINCTDIQGVCCNNDDLEPPCTKPIYPEECIDPKKIINTKTFQYGSDQSCDQACDFYVVVCKTRVHNAFDNIIGPLLPQYKQNCTWINKNNFRDNFYLDKNGEIQPVGNKIYKLSSDTTHYYDVQSAMYTCEGSRKWICMSPDDDPSIKRSMCVSISTLCYDVPDGVTVYDTKEECVVANECDTKVSVIFYDNYGCQYVSCYKDLTGIQALELIQQTLDNRNETPENTSLVWIIDTENNICQNENNKKLNDTDQTIFRKLLYRDNEVDPGCGNECRNGQLVNIVTELDECLECSTASLEQQMTLNISYIASPKCSEFGQNYNYTTGQCDQLIAGPCQKIRETNIRQPNMLKNKKVLVETQCKFYELVNSCNEEQICCEGECIPADEICSSNQCDCESYNRFICTEKIVSYYNVNWTQGGNAEPTDPDTIPSSQPSGTFYVSGQIGGCAGTEGILQDHTNYPGASCYNSSDPLRETGAAAARDQWYYRYRLVDDCSECVTNINENVVGECSTGTIAVSCVPFTEQLCTSYSNCLSSNGVDPCGQPPLP